MQSFTFTQKSFWKNVFYFISKTFPLFIEWPFYITDI